MELKIRYEQVNENHLDQATDLVMSAYDEERLAIPFLPDWKVHRQSLKECIRNLFKNGIGVAAIHKSDLIGFLCGFEVVELFGKCKGIYTPLYGHGAEKENRRSLYQGLYEQAANTWVKKDCMSHAITFFAHDNQTIDTWFWQGFGLRCVDAIREVVPIYTSSPSITVKKANIDDIPKLADIHRQHNSYYRNPPVFMPEVENDPIKDLNEWLDKDNHHLWVAYCEGYPLGYMKIEPSAESFVSAHKDVMNITGAYVKQNKRKAGIGAILLGEIQQWLLQNDYKLCGVDFEAINTTGSCFWTKFFTAYSYSMVRRIDERIRI